MKEWCVAHPKMTFFIIIFTVYAFFQTLCAFASAIGKFGGKEI